MPTTTENVLQAAHNAVERIENDIRDRKGFGNEFEQIDPGIRQEIHSKWEFIVANEIVTAVLAERKRCADVARNWGSAPARPGGRCDQLAAEIEAVS